MASTGSYQLSFGFDLKGATNALKGFNNQLKAAQAPGMALNNQLKQFGKITGIKDITKNVSNLTGKVATASKVVGGLVGLGSLAGIADMIKGFSDMSQQVENLSGKLGVASTALRGLQGAGSLTGLGNSFVATTEHVQDVQRRYRNGTASGDEQAAIHSMGLNNRMSSDQWTKTALQKTSNDMNAGMSAATARSRLGAAGVDPALMGLIEQAKNAHKSVSQYYDDMNARAQKLLRTNEQNTAAGAQLKQSFQGVGLAVQGFGNSIASKLTPALAPMLDHFSNWLATSPQANQLIDQISSGIAGLAKWVSGINWAGMAQGAMGVVNSLGGLKGIVEILVGFKVASWAVGATTSLIRFGSVAMKLAELGSLTELFGALGTAIAAIAAPVAIAVGAVAALGVAAYELYQHWDTVGPYFKATWDTVKDIFGGAIKAIQPLTDLVSTTFSGMWDGVKTVFDAGWSYISPIFDKVKGALTWIAGTKVGKAIGFVAQPLVDDFNKNLTAEKAAQASSSGSPADAAAGASTTRAIPQSSQGYKMAPQAISELMGLGLNKANATGYAANMLKESNFNPFASGDGGHAYGIGQWHEDRQAAYAKMFGHSMQSVMDLQQARREQEKFYVAESKTATGGNVFQKLQNNNDPRLAAATVSKFYERPANTWGEMRGRADIASNISASPASSNTMLAKLTDSNNRLADINNKQATTEAKATQSQITASQSQSFTHQMNIEVADGRIQARAKSGGGMTISPPRVHQVLPSAIV